MADRSKHCKGCIYYKMRPLLDRSGFAMVCERKDWNGLPVINHKTKCFDSGKPKAYIKGMKR